MNVQSEVSNGSRPGDLKVRFHDGLLALGCTTDAERRTVEHADSSSEFTYVEINLLPQQIC